MHPDHPDTAADACQVCHSHPYLASYTRFKVYCLVCIIKGLLGFHGSGFIRVSRSRVLIRAWGLGP